ncbi:hypothetical protein D9619_003908 [Psilocybe cf. subviscida]|uniref:Uncharacterized protein n=1 Tax=Psilocybe cf. subviscida TaxID=2480587 RepID=A0A8H5F8Y8_9AGAR|nr:hypothetical protein D9619_003908 [Psilocybe cf. subviscida]
MPSPHLTSLFAFSSTSSSLASVHVSSNHLLSVAWRMDDERPADLFFRSATLYRIAERQYLGGLAPYILCRPLFCAGEAFPGCDFVLDLDFEAAESLKTIAKDLLPGLRMLDGAPNPPSRVTQERRGGHGSMHAAKSFKQAVQTYGPITQALMSPERVLTGANPMSTPSSSTSRGMRMTSRAYAGMYGLHTLFRFILDSSPFFHVVPPVSLRRRRARDYKPLPFPLVQAVLNWDLGGFSVAIAHNADERSDWLSSSSDSRAVVGLSRIDKWPSVDGGLENV